MDIENYLLDTDTVDPEHCVSLLHKKLKKKSNEIIESVEGFNMTPEQKVRYLESLSYEVAKAAGVYDLSENTQVPKRPYVQSIQEYKIKDFFNYVKLLTKFVGCSVFEKITSHQQSASFSSSVRKTIPVDLSITSQDLEGREVKLSLNGMVFNKGKFGYAVVKEYLKFHPKATMAELKEIFHIGLLGSWGRWELLEDDLDYAKSLKESSGQFRHLVKDEFVLTSGDNIRFVVSNQWDKVNILNLLQIAKNQGWNYVILK